MRTLLCASHCSRWVCRYSFRWVGRKVNQLASRHTIAFLEAQREAQKGVRNRGTARGFVGRLSPNLKPETVCVFGIKGLPIGLNTTHTHHRRVLGQGSTFLPMFKPFRGPLVTLTRIVSGSRLGPDLPMQAGLRPVGR